MNCRELHSRLDDYFDDRAPPIERAAIEGHTRACESCRAAMAAERVFRERLRDLPVPEPDMARLEATLSSLSEAARLQRRWRRALFGGVPFAAAVVLGIAMTLEIPLQGSGNDDLQVMAVAPATESLALAAAEPPAAAPAEQADTAAPEPEGAADRVEAGEDAAGNRPEMPGLRLELNEVGELHLALESRRSLEEAIFTVMLPEGVELDDYPGQREVSWVGRIESGSNVVVLPLRSKEGKGGEITAHIAHIERQRSATLKMEAETDPPPETEPAPAEPATEPADPLAVM